MDTHYLIAYGRQGRPGHFEAACGKYIKPLAHSQTPNCDVCRAYIVKEAETDASMDTMVSEKTA